MPDVNKAIVIGVLRRDYFPNGGTVTTFNVVTTEHWKDKDHK